MLRSKQIIAQASPFVAPPVTAAAKRPGGEPSLRRTEAKAYFGEDGSRCGRPHAGPAGAQAARSTRVHSCRPCSRGPCCRRQLPRTLAAHRAACWVCRKAAFLEAAWGACSVGLPASQALTRRCRLCLKCRRPAQHSMPAAVTPFAWSYANRLSHAHASPSSQ